MEDSGACADQPRRDGERQRALPLLSGPRGDTGVALEPAHGGRIIVQVRLNPLASFKVEAYVGVQLVAYLLQYFRKGCRRGGR